MKLALLASGGKDSIWAAHLAIDMGHTISCMVNVIPSTEESYMYHHQNLHLLPLTARTMNMPLIISNARNDSEKEELNALKRALQVLDVDGVCTGAVASEYQRSRIQWVCDALNLKFLSPLWHSDSEETLREMVNKMDIMVVGVAADGLEREWLGRTLDRYAIEQLLELSESHKIHPMGEGGEYETFVLDAPLFEERFIVDDGDVVWNSGFSAGVYTIKEAHLEPKC